MSQVIGVPRETAADEKRVATVPEVVANIDTELDLELAALLIARSVR